MKTGNINKGGTYYLTNEESEEFIDQLIKNKATFQAKITNYSVQLLFDHDKYICAEEKATTQLFSAVNKIKNDIHKNKLIIDEVEQTNIDYYRIMLELNNSNIDVVFNVDIKSAYAKCLLNVGLITQETFDYLQGIPKKQRLKAVGMLATQSITYYFENGIPVDAQLKQNKELRNIFMYVCYEIGTLMNDISVKIGPDFLFYWVDGIYFKDNSTYGDKLKTVLKVLKEHNYNYSVDVLRNFKVKTNKFISNISFEKAGIKKQFVIPLIKNKHKDKIINLITSKIKKHEFNGFNNSSFSSEK